MFGGDNLYWLGSAQGHLLICWALLGPQSASNHLDLTCEDTLAPLDILHSCWFSPPAMSFGLTLSTHMAWNSWRAGTLSSHRLGKVKCNREYWDSDEVGKWNADGVCSLVMNTEPWWKAEDTRIHGNWAAFLPLFMEKMLDFNKMVEVYVGYPTCLCPAINTE